MTPFSFILQKNPPLLEQDFLHEDDRWFALALHEARLGLGSTHPNPPVGCVIIKDGKLIAKAHHQKAGEGHAESKALELAGEQAKGATLYVTLEPCSHFGKTPPCADHIIRSGVTRVVYGVLDPNPLVHQNGTKRLLAAGVEVSEVKNPNLISQAHSLIAPFAKYIREKKPWVLAKVAASLDGKIALRPDEKTAITHNASQEVCHQLRLFCDAILVGSNTVLIDDPKLTVRLDNHANPSHPLRVVLDSHLRTHPSHQVYQKKLGRSVVIHTLKASPSQIQLFDQAGVTRIEVPESLGHVDLDAALCTLGTLGITSVIIEGGQKIMSSFLKNNLIDETWWFTSPIILGDQGVSSVDNFDSTPPKHPIFLENIFHTSLSPDFLCVGRNQRL